MAWVMASEPPDPAGNAVYERWKEASIATFDSLDRVADKYKPDQTGLLAIRALQDQILRHTENMPANWDLELRLSGGRVLHFRWQVRSVR